jgi:hypothetical protein
LKAWKREILAYWHTDHSNAGPTEAINNVIETTRRLARGFRNFDNYRLRILASASGQRPYRQPPQPSQERTTRNRHTNTVVVSMESTTTGGRRKALENVGG